MSGITRYMSPVFRVCFPNLFTAVAMDSNSNAKYGVTAVWTPAKFSDNDKKRWQIILKALNTESMSAFKKPWKALSALNIKTGLRDGASKEDLDGFGKGTMFANITTKLKPGVVDATRNPISEVDHNVDEIYSGCYARATLTVYSYVNKGKGVALGLMNLQKVADGTRLDGRINASEDFEDDIDESWLEADTEDDIPF